MTKLIQCTASQASLHVPLVGVKVEYGAVVEVPDEDVEALIRSTHFALAPDADDTEEKKK